VFTISLRYACRAAQLAEGTDGCGDGLLDLLCGGFIGALKRRCEERVGPGDADAEVIRC
jgi:hypothetical protein